MPDYPGSTGDAICDVMYDMRSASGGRDETKNALLSTRNKYDIAVQVVYSMQDTVYGVQYTVYSGIDRSYMIGHNTEHTRHRAESWAGEDSNDEGVVYNT